MIRVQKSWIYGGLVACTIGGGLMFAGFSDPRVQPMVNLSAIEKASAATVVALGQQDLRRRWLQAAPGQSQAWPRQRGCQEHRADRPGRLSRVDRRIAGLIGSYLMAPGLNRGPAFRFSDRTSPSAARWSASRPW
jgi:hypothetical protein